MMCLKNRLYIIFLSCVVFLIAACQGPATKKQLPIFGPRLGETTKTVNGKEVKDTIYHTIPAFKVTNQDGKAITQADLDGNIYVADFFFTSCPSICPITQTNMLQVQKHFGHVKDFKMISFSIDPKHDSVSVLKDYATRIGANTNQWQLVRGDEDETYILAQKGFMASAMRDSLAPGGYAHSGAFILVDKEKRIRGIYNGVDSTAISLDIPHQTVPLFHSKVYHHSTANCTSVPR